MEPEKQQQTNPEKQQLTPELADQLFVLLQDDKLQVKYGALNTILAYTQTQESKLLFDGTKLFPLLISYLEIPEMTKICLSTMIHFSSTESFAVQLVDHMYPVIMNLRSEEGLLQELSLLLLLNVSKQAEFTEKMLRKQEDAPNPSKLSPLLLEILFSFMEGKPSRKWVIANIFVNVSSLQIGREYIAHEKLYLGFLKYINEESDALRLAVLRILRNVAFLWEKEEIISEILKQQHEIIDQICIHMLVMILKSNLVHDIEPCRQLLINSGYRDVLNYQTRIQPILGGIKTSQGKSLNEIEICVDIIIILSNSNFPERKPVFHMQELKRLIAQLNFTKISEETKDKLQALQTFCFW